MAKQIVWNKQGLRKLNEIISYLQEEVSLQSAINLNFEITKKLKLLSKFPEAGRFSKKKRTVRFVLIGRNRRMFYRVHGSKLFVVYFFDTHQSPIKSPY